MIIEIITLIFVIFFQGDKDQPNEGESEHLLRGSGSASFADAGRGSDVQVFGGIAVSDNARPVSAINPNLTPDQPGVEQTTQL